MFLKHALQPLFDARYRVRDCFVKVQRGNGNQWHRDKQTGSCVFRYMQLQDDVYTDASAAERVLLNAGPLKGQPPAQRRMMWRDLNSKRIVHSTSDTIVLMSANAAGSRCEANVEHARITDGVTGVDGCTISLDLALTHHSVAVESVLSGRDDDNWLQLLYSWFHIGGKNAELVVKHDLGKRYEADQKRRDEAFGRLLPMPVERDDEIHCVRCETRQAEAWRSGAEMKRPELCLCQTCAEDLHMMLRRKGESGSLRSVLETFQLFARCKDDCRGCHTPPPPSYKANGENVPSIRENMQMRAREFGAPADPTQAHCNQCGAPLMEDRRRFLARSPEEKALLCGACYTGFLEFQRYGDEIPVGQIGCDKLCPGCHPTDIKPSFIDGAVALQIQRRSTWLHIVTFARHMMFKPERLSISQRWAMCGFVQFAMPHITIEVLKSLQKILLPRDRDSARSTAVQAVNLRSLHRKPERRRKDKRCDLAVASEVYVHSEQFIGAVNELKSVVCCKTGASPPCKHTWHHKHTNLNRD